MRLLKKWLEKRFYPSQIFDSVSSIPLEQLKQQGIKGIILDLDDTLIPQNSNEISIERSIWLKEAISNFKVYLVTNNRSLKRIQMFQTRFNIPAIIKAWKPGTKGLLSAIKQMNLNFDEIVMIGDRLFTDVLAGNRVNVQTFLVTPIQKPKFLKWVRTLEKKMIDYVS